MGGNLSLPEGNGSAILKTLLHNTGEQFPLRLSTTLKYLMPMANKAEQCNP